MQLENKTNRASTLIHVLLFFLCVLVANAAPTALGQNEPPLDSLNSVSAMIIGGIAIGAGIFLVFLGYKLIVPTLFIAGAGFSIAIYFLILRAANVATAFDKLETHYLIIGGVIGVIAGVLAVLLKDVGFFALGCFLGYTSCHYILTIVASFTTVSNTVSYIIVGLLVITGGVLILLLKRPFTIVATAVIGSIVTFTAIDIFARQGYYNQLNSIVRDLSLSGVGTKSGLVAMLVLTPIFSLIGILVQFSTTG
ncbi:hypothetical protein AX774_g5398 [Zancudomyces culisetae]|uniref:Transmembrane protein 198 n=1 Tax=Zancudomyces culisetae TaxID=1213189 RepID=A0A1R1PJK7_ZANCU|nr:hypothetical protein AX774_g5398 [Zancudomyces culisetae]|eukprot:OMH81150.1 hypothetical protein AX774_g5398 [Zancudomyces culisetae]